jgi:hypothetical protein
VRTFVHVKFPAVGLCIEQLQFHMLFVGMYVNESLTKKYCNPSLNYDISLLNEK